MQWSCSSWEKDVSLDRKDLGIYVLFILELIGLSSERDVFLCHLRFIAWSCFPQPVTRTVLLGKEELHSFARFINGDFLSPLSSVQEN